MGNELPLRSDGEVPPQNEQPSDPIEQLFDEIGETARRKIGEHYATVRQEDRFQHEEKMEKLELEKTDLRKEERKSIREHSRKREQYVLQMVEEGNLSEENAMEIIKGLRGLEEKSLEMTSESPADEHVEVELKNRSSDEWSQS